MSKDTAGILLVDDEQGLVDLYREILTEYGYNITALHSAPRALKLLRNGDLRYDLVITDINL